jgi:formylglycine-generating enzyme required for sulfatase activity
MFANPFPFCLKTILRFLALIVPLIAPQLTAAPVVSNLTASQRAGTKLVDVGYDLTATGFPTVAVSLEISSDGGLTWTVQISTASGDIGSNVAPGTGKLIIWDASTDWPQNYSNEMNFRLVADDAIALIPGGSFTMGQTSGDAENRNDSPPTTVILRPFYFQKTETAKGDWDEVKTLVLSNGYTENTPPPLQDVNTKPSTASVRPKSASGAEVSVVVCG